MSDSQINNKSEIECCCWPNFVYIYIYNNLRLTIHLLLTNNIVYVKSDCTKLLDIKINSNRQFVDDTIENVGRFLRYIPTLYIIYVGIGRVSKPCLIAQNLRNSLGRLATLSAQERAGWVAKLISWLTVSGSTRGRLSKKVDCISLCRLVSLWLALAIQKGERELHPFVLRAWKKNTPPRA